MTGRQTARAPAVGAIRRWLCQSPKTLLSGHLTGTGRLLRDRVAFQDVILRTAKTYWLVSTRVYGAGPGESHFL